MKKGWKYFLDHIIDIVFIVVLLFYILACSLFTFDNPGFKCFLEIIFFIIIYYFLYKLFIKLQVKNEKVLKLLIVLLSIIAYFIWGYLAKTKPISDYAVLFDSAKEILKGNIKELTFNKYGYFYFWNFQIGYSLFLAGIMKIVGTSLISLKAVEILFLSFTNLLFYNITSKLFNKKTALLSTIIYSTFLFQIGGSSIINNQHTSFFFVMLGFYFLTKKDNVLNYLLFGLCLAISYILRQTVIVIVVSVVVFIIWKMFINNFKYWKKCLFAIVLIIGSFFMFTRIYDFIMIKTNSVPVSALNANAKYFKYVLGFQWQQVYGESVTDDLDYYGGNYETYNAATKDYVVYVWTHHFTDIVVPFAVPKMLRYAGFYDSQIDFSGHSNTKLGLYTKYLGYSQYYLVIIFSLLSTIYLYTRKNNDKNLYNRFENCFKIIFILMFCAYILIEVQPRYRYEQYFVLAIMSTPVLLLVFDYFDKAIKKTNSIKTHYFLEDENE